MLKSIAICCSVIVASAPTFAQDAPKPCPSIADSTERLKCFDDAAKQPKPKPTEIPGQWSLIERVDKLDGAKTVSISSAATDLDWGDRTPAILTIRCSRNVTELFLSWPSYLGSRGIPVRWRIGDAPIQSNYWTPSTDGRGAFAHGAVAIAKSMIGQKELIVSVAAYGAGARSATFDLSGIAEALQPLRKVCGW